MKRAVLFLLMLVGSVAMAKKNLSLDQVPKEALQTAESALIQDGKTDMKPLEAFNTGNTLYDVDGKPGPQAFCLCSFTQIIFQNQASIKCAVTVDNSGTGKYKVLAKSCQVPNGTEGRAVKLEGNDAEAFIAKYFPDAEIPGPVKGDFQYIDKDGKQRRGTADCFVPAMGGRSDGVVSSCTVIYY